MLDNCSQSVLNATSTGNNARPPIISHRLRTLWYLIRSIILTLPKLGHSMGGEISNQRSNMGRTASEIQHNSDGDAVPYPAIMLLAGQCRANGEERIQKQVRFVVVGAGDERVARFLQARDTKVSIYM